MQKRKIIKYLILLFIFSSLFTYVIPISSKDITCWKSGCEMMTMNCGGEIGPAFICAIASDYGVNDCNTPDCHTCNTGGGDCEY